MSDTFRFGKYRHYKGNDYIALSVVTHSETCETMVLYAPLYNNSGMWVRPLAMFIETVEINGVTQPRFRYLGEASKEEIQTVQAHFSGFA